MTSVSIRSDQYFVLGEIFTKINFQCCKRGVSVTVNINECRS